MMEVSSIVTLITLALTLILSFSEIRRRKSESIKNDADAVETLTDSVIKLLVPKDEEISRLNTNLSTLKAQIIVMEEDRHKEREKVQNEINILSNKQIELTHQIEYLIGELKRADTALEYLASITQLNFPKETEQAINIRRGKIIPPKQ